MQCRPTITPSSFFRKERINLHQPIKHFIFFAAGELHWFHKLNWILFSGGFAVALLVSALYWFTLAPTPTVEENLNSITFHLYATNSLLFLVKIFVITFLPKFCTSFIQLFLQ